MKRWSPQDLKKRFGHLDVQIQAERSADPKYEQNKLHHQRQVRLADFVDQVLAGGATNDYYLTANNEADCASNDSFLGFGTSDLYHEVNSAVTPIACGNHNHESGALTSTFGYVLLR